MISKEEVIKIANLARLELDKKEIEKMQKDLSSILDYFKLLKKSPKVAKEKDKIERKKAVRKDESRHSELADDLLMAVPDKKEAYVKVKNIL